jgi:ribosomal protein L40E
MDMILLQVVEIRHAPPGFRIGWLTLLIVVGLVVVVSMVRRGPSNSGQCAGCGAQNVAIAKFCRQCGQRLRGR